MVMFLVRRNMIVVENISLFLLTTHAHTHTGTSQEAEVEIVVDKSRWGELVEVEDESEEEEDDEDEEEEEEEQNGVEEKSEDVDVSGLTSVVSTTGYDTPSTTIELRKGIESVPKQLYTVLEQKSTSIDGNSLYGSDRKYVLPSSKKVMEHVDVALDPSELEDMDEDQIKAKYEEAKASGNIVKAPRKRKSRFGMRPDAKRARKEEE